MLPFSAENFEPYLSQVLKIRWEDELGKKNPLADREYSKLSTREKVEILHNLCDFRLDVEDVPELLKGLDADSLRVEPLGFDAEARTYWYFYGTRLYREQKSEQSDNKVNKKSKKKKKMEGKNRKKKGKVKKKKKVKGSSSDSEAESESSPSSDMPSSDYADDDDDDEEQEVDSEGKEDNEKKPQASWTVVCSTEDEWQQLAESFKRSKNKDEKMLYETLSVDFVPEIGKMIEAKDKAMRKKLLMEMAPRRASDRIASKAHFREEEEIQEENERQRERERAAEERKKEEEERQREKQQQAEKRQQERARRARMREERQWLMANGEFVPEELKSSLANVEESKDSEEGTSTRTSTRSKQSGEDIGLEDRDEDLYTGMYKVLDALKKHNNAWPFLEPVEESYAPQYYEIIEEPMDLSTIEQKLDDSKYTTLNDFNADMKLMFENCLDYNGPDSMYTKMANSLEAAFNRQIKKHFPEDDDNSDEDFEEELARKSKKDKRKKGESSSGSEMFGSSHSGEDRPFPPQMASSGMQSMFQNHMLPNSMSNGGMMPSHHPSRMPFPGPPHFSPDGRPLYPPQFYQNAFNPAAFARFGMSQPGPQYNRFRFPPGNPMGQMGQPQPQSSHFPRQRMPGRMPFQYGMGAVGGSMELSRRENDINRPSQTEQVKQLSPQQTVPVSTSGEPTPPSITGGTERGRQSQQQPHGGPPYYRPQSFNQAYLGYPRNGAMPYRAPGAGPYNQPMVPGREPWRLERRTPEAPPQRVPSREGSFREEAIPNKPPELTKAQAPNFTGNNKQSENETDSEEAYSEQEERKDLQANGREEPNVDGMQQTRSRVPATLSISHILSGASREDQQPTEGAKMREGPAQGTPQGAPTMHPSSSRQVIQSPEKRDRVPSSNEYLNRVPGKGPYDGMGGRPTFDTTSGRGSFGVSPNEGLDRLGAQGDPLRLETHERAFGMNFNDKKVVGNVAESVIKKVPQNSALEADVYKKMPVLTPIKEPPGNDVKDKRSREKTLESVSENGHLEHGKTETVPQRMPPADINKDLKGAETAAPFKSWPDFQPGSFLQELNDVGPPSSGGVDDKPALERNHRLPFTSMLRGMNPSQGSPENRGQYLALEAAKRERMRENMMAGNFLHSPEEKHERFNPTRVADMGSYAAMYGNKRPSDVLPPLQYRPNLSAMAHQRNIESAQMQQGGNSQFVDLNSMQYRYPSGLPSRESLTREQMYFLEQQQRRQHMASSMDAMMAGGQPERMIGFGGMLRQQQLFNAAYASHMRNGEFPGYPNEEIPSKMARFS